MGGAVESGIGIGIADDTSPRKVVIKKVQAELSQKYRARDETKEELEFLEKGGNLLDYKLQYVTSASVQSTSVTDLQNDRLVTNDAKRSSALATSSHGDSVETSGGPGAVPSEANSADNLMYFDAETEFSEGGRSLSRPCRSDVPVDLSLKINETKEHSDVVASTLPRKAYKRRYRSRHGRDGDRSSTMNVDSVRGGHGTSLSCHLSSRDVKDLEAEGENEDTKVAVLSSSISPFEAGLGKNETSGEPCLNDLDGDGAKSVEIMKNPVECVPQHTQPDYTDSSNPSPQQQSQEQPSAIRSPRGMDSNMLDETETMAGKTQSLCDSQLSMISRKVDVQMTAHETNGFKKKMEFHKSPDTLANDTYAVDALEPDVVNRGAGITSAVSNTNEIVAAVNDIDSSMSNKSYIMPDEVSATTKKDNTQETDHGPQNLPKNGLLLQTTEGSAQNISTSSTLLAHVTVDKLEICHSDAPEPSRKDPNAKNETSCSNRHKDSVDANYSNPMHTVSSMVSSAVDQLKTPICDSKLEGNIDENSILEEAQLIEARRKKIAELSSFALPAKIERRSHWSYVLEEMAWLSNDFAQERMWKIAAAAQISFKAAVACQARKEATTSSMGAKIVAHTLAKAVLEFWDSVVLKGTGEITQQENPRNNPIRAYAARLIVSNKPSSQFFRADSPIKPDSTSDWELLDFPEDVTPYEQTFYTAPPGSMETYRTSIMSHIAHIETIGSYVQEESEMSAYDGGIDFEFQDNLYDENEGETRTFDLAAAFDSSMPSRYGRKKIKQLKHGHGMGSYEASSGSPFQRSEIKLVKCEPGSLAKGPGSSLNVSVPTKRVRTATRRVISPFSAGPSGSFHLQNKVDALNGDTSSLQDDQSPFCAGLVYRNTLENDSSRDYEKQSLFESVEVSVVPKKKKAKHMNDDYDPRWQAESSFHEQQRVRFRRRSEAHMLESNGNGLFGQPTIKKPKVLQQSRDHPFDNPTQTGVSLPSPVASQFSNMHNSNKLVKILAGRDHGRKVKGPKIPTGQPGSESPWSVFEDQALVVLVHDHGPNWELISDAFNSALHFKCVFRNAEECKERHHTLMDRNSCDGADSADDSGSLQQYPSALPGIPKGSARQLFQRLLGPVEEDTLKSHFGKIITIGQKLLLRRSQDPKQLLQPHSSHSSALSQVFPNNLNGGPILTPIDLCDVVQGPDGFPNGMQVVHNAGSAGVNQSTTSPLLPASAGSALQGSPGFANSSARDGRHVIPRCGPLSADDQQKIQHYNQMIPGRNVSQATFPALGTHPGNDRGVRSNAGGTGMGVMGSGNRSFPMARPGLPGTSTSLVNSGSMGPSVVPPNMHAGLVTGQGSPMSRQSDTLQLMQDSPRQMSASGQGAVPHPRGLSSPLPNLTASAINHQTTLPMSPKRPQAQHVYFEGQANHAPTPQQQAYGPRFAKEQQLQQRMMLQQPQHSQQQYAASNSLARQVQSKPQLPLPCPIQTASQPHPSKNSLVNLSSLPSSSSMNSMPQYQQKHQAAALGVVQNTQSSGNVQANNIGKQQGRQHHLPQSSRHHPQRQQLQAPQQVKVSKSGSTGNAVLHPGDSSISNGVAASSISQPLDKQEAVSQFMQNQSLNTPSGVRSMQSSRPSSSFPQPKFHSVQGASAMKHIQTSKSDHGNQGHASPVAVPAANDSQQSCSPLVGATPDSILNSRGSAMSLSSNSYDTVSQDGQRPTAIKQDASERLQQSQVQKPPARVSQAQTPSQSGQAPQQSQLLQAGNGSLHGRPGDPALE